MKRFYLFTVTFLISLHVFPQSHIQWTTEEVTPFAQINEFKHLGVDKSGNSYFIDYTQDNRSLYLKYFLYRYDNAGNKQWEFENDSCFTDCRDNYFLVVPIDNDGAIFIGTYESLTDSFEIRIKRIGINGNLLWQKNWRGIYLAATPVVARMDNNGDLIVGFSATVTINDQEDFAIAKFDTSDGSPIWHLEIPDGGTGSTTWSENLSSMDIDAGNTIYASGFAGNTFQGVLEKVILSVNSSGVLNYRINLPTNLMNNFTNRVVVDNAGSLYFLHTNSTGPVVEKRLTSTGLPVWAQDIQHDSATVEVVDITWHSGHLFVLSNYKYFFPDTTFSGGHFSNRDYFISKLDNNGFIQWEKNYFENFDLLALQNGSGGATQLGSCGDYLYILSGQFNDSLSEYLLLNKIDTSGITQWYDSTIMDYGTGMMDFDSLCNVYVSRTARLNGITFHNVVQKFSDNIVSVADIPNDNSFVVYPNPATNEITVRINALVSTTTYSVYNSLGKKVMHGLSGGPEFTLPSTALSRGTYLIQIYSGARLIGSRIFIKN